MQFSRYVLASTVPLGFAMLRLAHGLRLIKMKFRFAYCKLNANHILIFARLIATAQMGLSGLEPPTSRLSGVRSNRLSYKPFYANFSVWQPPTLPHRLQCSTIGRLGLNHRVRDGNGCAP